MIEYLDTTIFQLQWPLPLMIISGAMLLIAGIAYAAKSLTAAGAVEAFFMGNIILWTTGFSGFLLFFLFFISCTIVGKISKSIRSSSLAKEVAEKKGHTRDFVQVLANGLMATIASALWSASLETKALVMFGAVVAEATSDTFAGEIGRLSKKKPVSILNFKPVPVGLSGGVTVLGLVAALLSSAVIAFFWYRWFDMVTISGAVLVGTMGFAGCIMDSVLGAGVQGIYYDPKFKQFSEDKKKDGRDLELSRGLRWVDNDMVNLMSNVFSGVFALGMASLVL
ncbi:MAG: DUF92 domain-containing protein [Spirochaetales bacterium]|nr:DUF92 domain-containing protein [Spirochaetales bacterium]